MTNSSRRTTRESADGRDHTNGWIYARLDDYWAVIDCKHVTAEFLDVGYPVVSIGEVQGRYVDVQNAPKTTRDFYMLLTQNPRKPVVGDLIMSRNASVGLVAQVADQNPLFAMGQDVCLLRRRKRSYSPDFMQFLLSSPAMEKQLTRMMAGSTFKRLNVRQIKDLTIPFPPAAVQASIGLALSDAEDLIATLNRVITKRKAIRQGIMQQLLTGKTRLPGFTDRWLAARFEELAAPALQRVDPQGVPAGTRLVDLEHIDSGGGRLLASATASGAVSLKTLFQPGDVLFGKLRAYLRKYWLADVPGICSTEIWVLRSKPLAENRYVRYLVETDRFIEVASGGYGTHMPRSDWGTLRGLEFEVPPVDEQKAIATALTEVDDEINGLSFRLAKAKAIKQGMLQQLLTGRTRLLVEKGAT